MPELEDAKSAKEEAVKADAEVAKIEPEKAERVISQVFDAGSRQQVDQTVEAICGVALGIRYYLGAHQAADYQQHVQDLKSLVETLEHLKIVSDASKK